ncbi:MAG TPA: PTS sugar transporter subunit IIB [Anaeromyxobacter sp.]|nr:PTS sugar transporter subunit IIB [Anaeromyxobacter sp.]
MIVLVRVDNRLLHGQILEAWVPKLRIQKVVVADDAAATSPLALAAMTLCVPPELPIEVKPVGEVDYAALANDRSRTLVLVRDVADLSRARTAGLTAKLAPTVNVGNVHFAPGRHAVTPSVFLGDPELEALRSMEGEGFAIEARAIPAEPPTGMAELERRYAAAR